MFPIYFLFKVFVQIQRSQNVLLIYATFLNIYMGYFNNNELIWELMFTTEATEAKLN